MKKTIGLMLMAVIIGFISIITTGCGDTTNNEYNNYSNSDLPSQITFRLAEDSPSGQIITGNDAIIMSFDIECEGKNDCRIEKLIVEINNYYENLIYQKLGNFWIESEDGETITEILNPVCGQDRIYFSNLVVEKNTTQRFYLMVHAFWGTMPGDPEKIFNVELIWADYEKQVEGLPLKGNDLYSVFAGIESYLLYKDPASPTGLKNPGAGVELLRFGGNTSLGEMILANMYFSFGGFDGQLNNCKLKEGGTDLAVTSVIDFDNNSGKFTITFWPNNQLEPAGIKINPQDKTFSLTCDVSVSSPNQTVAVNLESIGWYVNTNGIYYEPEMTNYPIFQGNLILFP